MPKEFVTGCSYRSPEFSPQSSTYFFEEARRRGFGRKLSSRAISSRVISFLNVVYLSIDLRRISLIRLYLGFSLRQGFVFSTVFHSLLYKIKFLQHFIVTEDTYKDLIGPSAVCKHSAVLFESTSSKFRDLLPDY